VSRGDIPHHRRWEVFKGLADMGRGASRELEAVLHLPHQTVSARLTELEDMRLVAPLFGTVVHPWGSEERYGLVGPGLWVMDREEDDAKELLASLSRQHGAATRARAEMLRAARVEARNMVRGRMLAALDAAGFKW